ncbi:MAG: hypothetical protein JST76_06395 [Bacteroidetes bacterium]|nr:hypothetical protein [Bacteroidota bacterium]
MSVCVKTKGLVPPTPYASVAIIVTVPLALLTLNGLLSCPDKYPELA